MKVSIDKKSCMGCGVCSNFCPQGIEIVEGRATVKNENADCFEKAADVCPINIIKIS